MRAGANILSPINVSVKFPPGTVVDYAYNVFYQVNNFKWVYISFSTVASKLIVFITEGSCAQEVLLPTVCAFEEQLVFFFCFFFLFCEQKSFSFI